MIGIFVAIFSFFAGATSGILDKFILSKKITNPLIYVFYVGALNVLTLFLVPFIFLDVGPYEVMVYFIVGLVSLLSLVGYYYAFSFEEVTKVAPVVVGFTPAFSLFHTIYFLDQPLSGFEIFAFALLVVGSVMLVLEKKTFQQSKKAFLLAVGTAFLLAVYSALFKYALGIRGEGSFLGVFFWTRFSIFIAVMPLLLVPSVRGSLFPKNKEEPGSVQKPRTLGLIFLTKAIGAAGSFSLGYAMSLSNIAIVNSLSGLQFGFLFFMMYLISKKYPKILAEDITKSAIIRKVASFVIIAAGIGILSFWCSGCFLR